MTLRDFLMASGAAFLAWEVFDLVRGFVRAASWAIWMSRARRIIQANGGRMSVCLPAQFFVEWAFQLSARPGERCWENVAGRWLGVGRWAILPAADVRARIDWLRGRGAMVYEAEGYVCSDVEAEDRAAELRQLREKAWDEISAGLGPAPPAPKKKASE